jgi:hypothetical protein
MTSHSSLRCLRFLGVALILATMMTTLASGADRIGPPPKSGQTGDQVEMFQAIEDGNIAVRLVPKDSKECRVIIENKTKKPLTVKLPETFAGVPVLAQVNNNNNNNNNRGGQNQGMGGGMGMGGMGGGMGAFYIPPEKTGQLKVTTVCLEHGKAEPRPNVPYEIKPIESFTNNAAVAELCRLLGHGQINQRAAQAAAWNLNNNMSWEQLAAKRLKFANGTSQPYFSPQEIRAGMQAATVAGQMAEQRQKQSASSTSAAQ